MQFRLGLATVLVLAGCTPDVGLRPTSEAGTDQVVLRSDTVLLDGSQSADADGTIESWTWTLLSAPIYS